MTRASLEIDNPPDFAVRYGWGRPPARHIKAIFDHHRDAQAELLGQMAAFSRAFSMIPLMMPDSDDAPRWIQDWIPPLDLITLYAFPCLVRPPRIIEIGSGNSSKIMRRAIRDQDLPCHLTSIDPVPRVEMDHLADCVIRSPLEQVDLGLFDALQSGDMIFFDGSHRCLQNSDVTVFFVDILPRLPAGVLIGIHDIRWPDDYPDGWRHRIYSEQYILAAHMLAQGDRFPLVLSNAYASTTLRDLARACVQPPMLALLADGGRPEIFGTTLWFHSAPPPFSALSGVD